MNPANELISVKQMTEEERQRECLRLSTEIQVFRNKISSAGTQWRQHQSAARQKTRRSQALGRQIRAGRALDIALNALGAAISGGTSLAMRGAIRNTLSAVGGLIGFSSPVSRLKQLIKEVRAHITEMERLNGEHDFYTQAIRNFDARRGQLGCINRL